MNKKLKAGLIGFVVIFVVLWFFLLITGHSENGWKCSKVSKATYCNFSEFILSPINWAFAFFFSLLGFFGGLIDNRLIRKTIENQKIPSHKKPLKITLIIMLTFLVISGIISLIAFESWIKTVIYLVIFSFFIVLVSWVVEKKRYS